MSKIKLFDVCEVVVRLAAFVVFFCLWPRVLVLFPYSAAVFPTKELVPLYSVVMMITFVVPPLVASGALCNRVFRNSVK